MSTELTPEKIMEYGRQFQNIVLAGLKPKERLAGLKPKERLEGLKPEELKELDKYLKELMKKKSI